MEWYKNLLCGFLRWTTVLSSLNMLTSSMSWSYCIPIRDQKERGKRSIQTYQLLYLPNFLMVDLSFLSSLTSPALWTTFLILLWVPMIKSAKN